MLNCEGTEAIPLYKLNMTLTPPPNTSGIYHRPAKEPKYFTVAKNISTLANNAKVFQGVNIKESLMKASKMLPKSLPLPRMDDYPVAPKGSYYKTTELEDLSRKPTYHPYLHLASSHGILAPSVGYSTSELESLTSLSSDAPSWLREAFAELSLVAINREYSAEDLEVQDILGTGMPSPASDSFIANTEDLELLSEPPSGYTPTSSGSGVPLQLPKRDPAAPSRMLTPPTQSEKPPRKTSDVLARREAILMSPSVAARVETTPGSLVTRGRAYERPRVTQQRPSTPSTSSGSSFEIPVRRGGTTTASLAQRALMTQGENPSFMAEQ